MIPFIKRATRPPIITTERADSTAVLAMSILVIVACLPLLRFFHWQITLFLFCIAALRLISWRWRAALPPTGLRAVFTLTGIANCLYSNHTLVGLDGGAALLATMMLLKLLELNTKRDLRVLAILIGFLVVIQFLFDQSLLLALYCSLIVFGMITLLLELNSSNTDTNDWKNSLRLAGYFSIQALPIMLCLFLLFPRLNAPLWNLGLDSGQAMVGMSDHMEPGAISELAVSGELAFRARFEGAIPPVNQLYWRGLVLWNMDGRRWSQLATTGAFTTQIEIMEKPVRYDIILEPTQQKWLFALDVPVTTPTTAQRNTDLQLLAPNSIDKVYRYSVQSVFNYRLNEPSAARRALGLQLPYNVTPRMRELVAGWRQQAANDWELVQQGLAFFSREQFYYTLLPPRLGLNPTDEFLFETRQGFCEHYASAFALLMRIGGIPARVVLGYLGGEFNALGGYLMVWQSDAHAWVEVLIAERGWVRIDPTAAIDPTRIDHGSASQLLNAGQSARFHLDHTNVFAQWARQIRVLADTVNAAWQNWVLDFSAQDQLMLLEQIGFGAWKEYGLAILMLITVALTLGLTVLGLLRQRPLLTPLEAHYMCFCRRLARVGLVRQTYEGPRDFGQRVVKERPELAECVNRFLAVYIPARFGAQTSDQLVNQLAQLMRHFYPHQSLLQRILTRLKNTNRM